MEITLDEYVGRLVTVDAVVGADSVRLIFDTGGGGTVLSPGVAESIGCIPSGRTVGYRMNGERVDFTSCPDVTLEMGGVSLVHDRIGIWDVMALLPDGLPHVDGVLSLASLADHPFTLDLAERRLTLETAVSLPSRTAGMTLLNTRLATGNDGDELTVFVHGVIEDQGWFLMDSANLDLVQAASHVAEGTAETWSADLALDGLPPVMTNFRTADIIYDGALSEEFLRQWIWTFDLSSGRVWAVAARAPGD